ncbi:MAG: alpha-galactosidase [Deltaproteobacteria bacterium]|nr:alpha-galactosidase [Deltaproteobacteria bacterium]
MTLYPTRVVFVAASFLASSFLLWASPSTAAVPEPGWHLNHQGLAAKSADSEALLRPVLRTKTGWVEPRVSDCELRAGSYTCRLDGYGYLRVEKNPAYRVVFEATSDTQVRSIGLSGQLKLPGARGWLSNGFQSWSQTGFISLQAEIPERELDRALALVGEDEVYRRGPEMSWWYSYAAGGDHSFLAGASSARHLKSWVQMTRPTAGHDLAVKLVSGATEELTVAAGNQITSENFYLYLGPSLSKAMADYSAAMPSRRKLSPKPTPVGWNSWYELWNKVKPQDLVSNARIFADLFQPRIPDANLPGFVVLDDGWQQAWGDWYPNTKFPHGIATVARELSDQGFQMGIWIAPLLVAKGSRTARLHPDWLVQGANYSHPTTGEYGVLDVTHPAAAAHLQQTIERLVGWGVKLIKIDFLFAGTIEGKRHKKATGTEAYERALSLIRAAAGTNTELLAVGSPPIPTMSYVDGWRVGGDIAFTPSLIGWPPPTFAFIANQARSVAGRYPFCLATLCDADPILMRAPLPEHEVQLGSWVVASTGGALFLSDDLPKLTAERVFWGLGAPQLRAALSGRPALPVSFVPPYVPQELVSMKDNLYTAEHDVPNLWRMPDGTLVALNFSHSPQEIAGRRVPAKSSLIIHNP